MNDKHFGIFRDCNRFIFILMSCQFRPKNKKKTFFESLLSENHPIAFSTNFY